MLALASVMILGCSAVRAQQPIGTVALEDATITGNLSVTGGRAVLAGSSSVTAKDHTAEITLNRGGTVRVCATSGLHLTQSQGAGSQPLMLALDRGAFEVHTAALANDVVLTPDLRFAVQSDGVLDLRIRVTRNGDTCVDNKGAGAPVLRITDPFSEGIYELRRGQHVLFEHGSLKEVVDQESSPCGCPEPVSSAPEAGVSVAEALLAPGTPGKTAAEHPFPAAVSQGLAPPPPVPQATPGEVHAQVSASVGFNGDGSGTVAGTPVPSSVSSTSTPAALSTPATPAPSAAKPGFAHRVGHFFKRLFGGGG